MLELPPKAELAVEAGFSPKIDDVVVAAVVCPPNKEGVLDVSAAVAGLPNRDEAAVVAAGAPNGLAVVEAEVPLPNTEATAGLAPNKEPVAVVVEGVVSPKGDGELVAGLAPNRDPPAGLAVPAAAAPKTEEGVGAAELVTAAGFAAKRDPPVAGAAELVVVLPNRDPPELLADAPNTEDGVGAAELDTVV